MKRNEIASVINLSEKLREEINQVLWNAEAAYVAEPSTANEDTLAIALELTNAANRARVSARYHVATGTTNDYLTADAAWEQALGCVEALKDGTHGDVVTALPSIARVHALIFAA